jgi:hypothetical protein
LVADSQLQDDICTFAKSALNDAKSAEDIFYSVSILENLGCGETVSKSVIGILETALGGTNLEGYYFAVSVFFFFLIFSSSTQMSYFT